MPRKKKTVDILANLEAIMKGGDTYSELVKAEAAKEYFRLKAKEQPAPAPAPVVRRDPTVEEIAGFLKDMANEQKTKSEPAKPVNPVANPESESQEFTAEKCPSPVEPKPVKPYVWRDERGRTVEMIKADMLREKQAASREWAASMGLSTTHPEWPGV